MRGREVDEWLRHSGPGLVCLAQCISGVWYVPLGTEEVGVEVAMSWPVPMLLWV